VKFESFSGFPHRLGLFRSRPRQIFFREWLRKTGTERLRLKPSARIACADQYDGDAATAQSPNQRGDLRRLCMVNQRGVDVRDRRIAPQTQRLDVRPKHVAADVLQRVLQRAVQPIVLFNKENTFPA
jgi:hypothetical protein